MYIVLHFHKASVNICQIHLDGLVKIFWEVLVYILYTVCLMIIPSCKFILISCECILKLNFFFLQWTILIGPSQKNHDTLLLLKH